MFCEKPFALTVADAKAAIAACRKAGVALGVGHNRRLWPSIVKLKEIVSSAEFGTVMFAEGNYSHDILANTPLDNWRSRAAGDQGRRHDRHGHPSARRVQFPGRPDGARQRALDQTHPAVRSRATPRRRCSHSANGATGTIATSLKTPGFVWRLAVYGSDMWAESLSETNVTLCRRDEQAGDVRPAKTNHIGTNLEFVRRAALGKARFQIDDAGIVHTVAALEAVFDSAERNGAWRDIA